jgi:hypothetical protein
MLRLKYLFSFVKDSTSSIRKELDMSEKAVFDRSNLYYGGITIVLSADNIVSKNSSKSPCRSFCSSSSERHSFIPIHKS